MARVVPATKRNIEKAAAQLSAGRLVAFPTETVYGLGAVARDSDAVQSIYRLKGRPQGHPLIVHLPGAQHMESWAEEVPQAAVYLAQRFWPGPLTLVLRRSKSVPDAVTGGQETVALRSPQHPVAQQLLAAFGDGVAAPSANRFGRISPTSAAHVAAEFPEELLVLDGGPSQVGLESTILDLSQAGAGGAPRLLRPGGVPLALLEEALGQRVHLPGEGQGAAPRVPGSLGSHYAASAPTQLVAPDQLAVTALAAGAQAAVLALQPAPEGFTGRWLRLPQEPVGYGSRLYAALRELDALSPQSILIEAVPADPEWLAVRDRLQRATAT